MKRVLIISYYYPPNNAIPSWRPHSWANHFQQQGYDTHVVCRFWRGNETSWQDMITGPEKNLQFLEKKASNLYIHQLPAHKIFKGYYNFFIRYPFLSKIFVFMLTMLGYFHIEVDGYFSFKKYIIKTFAEKQPDIVIITSPPLNLVRLGAALKKTFPAAVFVADFRDLWDNKILSTGYKPGRKVRFMNTLYSRYIKKWLKKYSITTSVSTPLLDELKKLSVNKHEVITNGYEQSLFSGIAKQSTNNFTISAVGSIFPDQHYEILCRGIINFVKKNKEALVQVSMIGLKDINPPMCTLLQENIPAEKLKITGRLTRTEALQQMKNADVLVYPAWPGFKGIYSGKIFEYIGSGNKILIAPGDDDVIDALIKETNAGISAHTEDEVTHWLQIWYTAWLQHRQIPYTGKADIVKKYSREAQAQKLENIIMQVAVEK